MAFRETFAEIHLGNLRHNASLLRSLVPKSQFFCPMVKAQAYGHGDVECAGALETVGADALGVVMVEEAVRLRESGSRIPLLVFGVFEHRGARICLEYGITPVLSTWESLKAFEELLRDGARSPVHLKFDTGMSRMGFSLDEVSKLKTYFSSSKKFDVEAVCSHFLNGEDAGVPKGRTAEQVERFQEIAESFPSAKTHLMNSSAILLELGEKTGARPGLALYGVHPPSHRELTQDLRPVMTFRTRIAVVRKIASGETVSYGGMWTAKKDSWIATLPVGYADGYPRALSNKGIVEFRGTRVPVRGIVCMDYIMIDVTEASKSGPPKVGEDVTLFGSDTISIKELAELAGTIPYEIMTRLGARVPRIIKSS